MSKNIHKEFKMPKSITALAVGAALMMSAPSALAADNFSGTVKGQIVSSAQSAIANATITFKHKEKGITRSVQADANGDYILRKLPIGVYTVTISKQGFESDSFDLLVKIGSDAVLNKQLYTSSEDIERISVTGSQIAQVDLSSSTGGIVVTSEDLQLLPVESGFNNVALLAPGAAKTTGSSFNGSPSIGGGSSAENGYYLNGLNVTQIKTGLGNIDLPWEAISQTEILNGGVAPEFGNALGGIINSISKSGTNEFEFGVEARVDPESLREHHDDLFYRDGSLYSNTEDDESTFTRYSVWGSGPIIEDTLFFYGLLAPQKNDYDDAKAASIAPGESTSDRWFAKIDWFITENHSLEFTALNYENENEWKTYSYDWETNERSGEGSKGRTETGGDVFGLKYTGLITDDISIEIVAGRVTDEVENTAADALPSVWSRLSGGWQLVSHHTNSTITESEFERDQFRVDLSWDLEDHSLKFGADYYDTHVDYVSTQNGAGDAQGWWSVNIATGTDRSGFAAGEAYVDQRIRDDFSDSHVKSLSFYAQDSWQATENLVLNLGVRYNDFENEMSDGQKYVDISGQVAPRLQAIYDLNGDGETKIYATYGRYFQPVSANMNIVQGGSRRDEHWYYNVGDLDSNGEIVLNSDGSPSRGSLENTYLAQSGEGAPGSKADQDLKPMYSDEFSIGYETEVFDGDMVFGVRGMFRELKRSIEDADLQTVLKNWYEKEGIAANGWIDGWILFNPGRGLDVEYDFNGDGTVNHIELSKEEMGMPKSERKYGAIEFTLNGAVTDRFMIDASYTWSHLWGNTSGLVNDDDNQADPGWTVSYDYAGLQDNASGNLPSDRRHAFKLFGTYEVIEDLHIGFNTLISSGKPVNYMGIHPEGVGSCAPGLPWESCPSNEERGHGASFYNEYGNPSPRGSAGTTDWTVNVDLSATYYREVFGNQLMLKATAYNLFNDDATTRVFQTGTKTNDAGEVVGNSNWGITTARQSARYVSIVARYDF